MTVKYLTDQSGKTTDVQLSFQDYLQLLERANELPEYVKNGIKRGQAEARSGKTMTTEQALAKYEKK